MPFKYDFCPRDMKTYLSVNEGDIVRITREVHGHGFQAGEYVRVIVSHKHLDYDNYVEGHEAINMNPERSALHWYIYPNEFEISLNKKLRKKVKLLGIKNYNWYEKDK